MLSGIVKGDNIELEITANVNITGWEIRAEFYDVSGNSVKLATANVTGGSSDQISIDDAANGIFTIKAPAGGTTNFDDKAFLEIERTDGTNKLTIYQDNIEMKKEQITWTSVS